jgi:hypothetical protein
MRKMIVMAMIVAAATITAAWSMSEMWSKPNKAAIAMGGGGGMPTRMPALW